jgi:hypothetical protein
MACIKLTEEYDCISKTMFMNEVSGEAKAVAVSLLSRNERQKKELCTALATARSLLDFEKRQRIHTISPPTSPNQPIAH